MKKFLLCLCTVALAAMLCVGIFAAETVIYENDFSNPATLSDFEQYRQQWEIKDGGLYLTETFFPNAETQKLADSFAHILYKGGADLADYIVEVDYMNFQTAGGIIFRADEDKADHQVNGFYGYLAFIANDANKGALGNGSDLGKYKGNIHVGAGGNCNLGSNAHIKVTVKGEKIHVLITNIDNGKVIYDYSYTIGTNENDQIWKNGTFGFRMRAEYTKNSAKSANQAYFDNLKVTTANEVDLGGTGVIPDAPVGEALKIDTSNLTPVYTNNFDKAADIEDWTQYRGTWSVYQGKLYLSACTGGQSFILYGGKADLVGLTDYVVDVDMYNIQTQGGIVARSDYANVTGETDSGIMGYQAFVSNTATQGALGAGQADGKWLEGNIKVGPAVMQPGMNVHLQFAVKGNVIQFVISDLASGKVLWQWSGEHDMWSKGTFGFRMRGTPTSAGLDNLNKTGFDNLVVSTFGASAPVAAEKTEVKITVDSKTAYVNGKEETLSAPAINRGGRVLLPVRFLANAFGVSNDGIAWDGATRTATLKNDKVTIVVTIDAPSMTVNGETVALDSPAIISDNSTYLPVRAIANALGVANENIAWDAATNTATLVK